MGFDAAQWTLVQGVRPPSVPTLQSPSNGTTFNESDNITLSWSGDGTQYSGQYWGGPAGTITFGPTTTTSYTIGSQWAGYTYSWQVEAQNSAGTSPWSSTWTFTVTPAAPSMLAAQSASCSQINLAWLNNSGSLDGFNIYRNGTRIAQVGANTFSYQDSGLSASTTYSYTVSAYKGSIESNASNTASATTPACSPPPTFTFTPTPTPTPTPVCSPTAVPPAPTSLNPPDGSSVSSTTPVLSWANPPATACVIYYNIQIYDNQTGEQAVNDWSGTPSYTVPGGKLALGKSYTWWVWGYNSQGWSGPGIATFWVEVTPTPSITPNPTAGTATPTATAGTATPSLRPTFTPTGTPSRMETPVPRVFIPLVLQR